MSWLHHLVLSRASVSDSIGEEDEADDATYKHATDERRMTYEYENQGRDGGR